MILSATTSDMGRRWLILGTIFVNLAVIYGAWYAYSVFLVALLKEFGWSRTGSYAWALWAALTCAIIAPALMWVAAPRRPHPAPLPVESLMTKLQ